MRWPECAAEFPPRKYGTGKGLAYACTRRRCHPGDHKAGTTPGQYAVKWRRLWQPLPEDGGGPWISGTRRGTLLGLGLLACLASVNLAPQLSKGEHGIWPGLCWGWYGAGWVAYIYGYMRLKADQRRRRESRQVPSLAFNSTIIMRHGQPVLSMAAGELLLEQAGKTFADYMDVNDRQVCVMIRQVIAGQQS